MPLTAPVKLMAVVGAALHTVCPLTVFTVGVGFTVMVNVPTEPAQPFAEGVTEIMP